MSTDVSFKLLEHFLVFLRRRWSVSWTGTAVRLWSPTCLIHSLRKTLINLLEDPSSSVIRTSIDVEISMLLNRAGSLEGLFHAGQDKALGVNIRWREAIRGCHTVQGVSSSSEDPCSIKTHVKGRLPVSSATLGCTEDLPLQIFNLQIHDDLDRGANIFNDLEAICLPHQLLLLLI